MVHTAQRPVRVKPHHLVDIVSDLGAGHPALSPSPYGHALHTVTARILADPHAVLVIELGADHICAPCIHNVEGHCDDILDVSYRPAAPVSKGAYNLLIDRRWCERLGLGQDDRLAAVDFCERLLTATADIASVYAEEPEGYASQKARDIREGIRRLLSSADCS